VNCVDCSSEDVEVLEYDKDEDLYVYRCNNCGIQFTLEDDTETWK
jgi:uncharacterized Zn finger protein